MNEFLPKWQQKPPRNLARHGIEAKEEVLKQELHSIAQEAITFQAPQVRIVYKASLPNRCSRKSS
jgi:hypothetical protein